MYRKIEVVLVPRWTASGEGVTRQIQRAAVACRVRETGTDAPEEGGNALWSRCVGSPGLQEGPP